MTHGELGRLLSMANRSYVLRPFYPHLGSLDYIVTPEGGDLSVATARMCRWIPFPRVMLPYPEDADRTTKALIKTVNGVLPVRVPKYTSVGTAAIVDSGRPLPAIDLLPQPLRWENPLRLGHYRALPGLPTTFGRPRNLPSGRPLTPVPLSSRDQKYFAPLATEPAKAVATLSPTLLELTRHARVAWWSEETKLFVWVHECLPADDTARLAETAEQIHQQLLR